MNGYAALGICNRRSTIVGEGDIYSTLINAAGEITKNVVSNVQQQDAAQKAAGASASALSTVVAADQAATNANAQALVSAASKSASASADQMVADQASSAQDVASAGLSPENQKKRSDIARKALESATSAWQAASAGGNAAKTKLAEFKVKAAQMTYAKTQNAQMVQQGSTGLVQQESFFTRKVLGPIPGWGVVTGIVAIIGIAAVVFTKVAK